MKKLISLLVDLNRTVARLRQTSWPSARYLSTIAVALIVLGGCANSEPSLSETALYADIGTKTLASDVEEFAPQFPLWSDGVEKRRFIRLPQGAQIDTSDMDVWVFPVGTELYKEFSKDGQPLETRLQRRNGDGSWTMVAYVWNADGSDANIAALGASNINGSAHDSPPVWDCTYCHGANSQPLGFSAIQLNHDGDGLTLSKLIDRDLITAVPQTPLELPGDALDRQVLGALHANCGSCHRDDGELRHLDLRLALTTNSLDAVESTPFFQTAVDHGPQTPISGLSTYIRPGWPEQSLIASRMAQRGGAAQMPPIGTEQVDEETNQALNAWILRLRDGQRSGQ